MHLYKFVGLFRRDSAGVNLAWLARYLLIFLMMILAIMFTPLSVVLPATAHKLIVSPLGSAGAPVTGINDTASLINLDDAAIVLTISGT